MSSELLTAVNSADDWMNRAASAHVDESASLAREAALSQTVCLRGLHSRDGAASVARPVGDAKATGTVVVVGSLDRLQHQKMIPSMGTHPLRSPFRFAPDMPTPTTKDHENARELRKLLLRGTGSAWLDVSYVRRRFGGGAFSTERRQIIDSALEAAGVAASPPLADAGRGEQTFLEVRGSASKDHHPLLHRLLWRWRTTRTLLILPGISLSMSPSEGRPPAQRPR